jgi:hypothetical protein
MGGEVDGVFGEKRWPSGDGDASGNGEAPSMGARRRCGGRRCWSAGGSSGSFRRRRIWLSGRGSKADEGAAELLVAASVRKASTSRSGRGTRGMSEAKEAS